MKKYHNPRLNRIFQDLEDYKDFCREYGYIYNEADLYRGNSAWGLMQRVRQGKNIRNNWVEDARRFQDDEARRGRPYPPRTNNYQR